MSRATNKFLRFPHADGSIGRANFDDLSEKRALKAQSSSLKFKFESGATPDRFRSLFTCEKAKGLALPPVLRQLVALDPGPAPVHFLSTLFAFLLHLSGFLLLVLPQNGEEETL